MAGSNDKVLEVELNKTNVSWHELLLLKGNSVTSQEALKKRVQQTNVSWHT